MRKGKNRYIVDVNDWGCGLMIKDTQTGREIDAPDDEVITLCIKEMNSLAKELDTVRSVAEDNQAELKATRIENARLKEDAERYRLASIRVDVGELHAQFNRALFDETVAENARLKAEVERLTVRLNRACKIADTLHSNMRDCYYYVPAEQEWEDFRKEDGVDL